MYTMLTSRVHFPYVLLFVYFFFDVNARSLTLRNGKNQPKNEKNKGRLASIFVSRSPTMRKHSSTNFDASNLKTTSIIDSFKRPLSFGEEHDLDTKSVRKCKQSQTKRRFRRYVLHGSKMRKLDIKWGIAVYSKKLSDSQQKTVLEKAFQTWAAKCRLTFIYTSKTADADIVIKFLTGDHGDHQKFDDAGDLKAHAFFPSAGSDIHFDEYETWVADPSGKGGISLLSVAIHEIGHSLGLRHSHVKSAVMVPVLHNGRNILDNDDIRGIQAMYGSCSMQSVDAVVTGIPGFKDKALVFKNEWVWDVEISTGNINTGYPKKTANYFNGVLGGKAPFKTVFYDRDYTSYVFMYSSGYTVISDTLSFPVQDKDIAYGVEHSEYPFLKSAPDAAFVDPKNKAIYHFFQGSRYYKFNMDTFKLVSGTPKAISAVWPGVPNDIDAAYHNYNQNKYYFIKKNEYFTLDSKSGRYYPSGVLTDIFRNICPI